jgi:hypothetical protein
MNSIDVFVAARSARPPCPSVVHEILSAFSITLHPLENSAPLQAIFPVSLLQHPTNFGTTLAAFHKKHDANPLFQLLVDLHLDNG